ncbi:gram-negative porin family protein [Paraburkholderia xenovorans LB400]|uniref:Outer membrane porin, OmpC family n=1 Tax=Paraburkholderia xenovorans (strain LB400) TaxID=266265 RepID=Q142Z8_PARXL|nr:porin [Paraburkholderia xenovorans]ABE29591.1 outer membrane porin, OmpC family [Paraburkholderia xenovorans LB400]AIP30180.1 gram-negative porin family protein [Paraburkholderia xenovorans LB400]
MKKALLAAALMTAGVVAHAQSSVTLYGRLDAGIEYMTGVPQGVGANGQATGSTNRWRAESGDWGTSLWGLKGVEDIGGGNKVLFQLEGSFNTMTGAGPGGGGLFNRWATVGLSNDQYGTFTMGRMLFISNGDWDFDPFGQSNWSSASLVRGRNWPQSSNNFAYQSPKIAGFDFYGQYALSNATSWNGNGTTPQGREAGAQITYTNSLFQIRGMYDEIRNPTNGTLYGPNASVVNAGNIGSGVFAASREYSAFVNVFLGQFKIQGAYQAIRSAGATGVLPGQPTTLDHEWGGVTWQATPAAALIAAVYHVNGNNGAGNATIYTVGGSYNLSKRTLLDIQVATTQNSKTANYGLNANNAGTATSTDNPLPGHSQTGVYAGIQHSF